MALPSVLLTPEGIFGTTGVLVLGVVFRVWRYLGLPAYWAYRHLFFLVVDRESDTVRVKWGKMFAPEMDANASAREVSAQTARDLTALRESMTGVGSGLAKVGDLATNVGLLAQRVGDLVDAQKEMRDTQGEHSERIAALDATIIAWDGRDHRAAGSRPRLNGKRSTDPRR